MAFVLSLNFIPVDFISFLIGNYKNFLKIKLLGYKIRLFYINLF